jgi:predicted transposase/invertase (TIGR01784 family)
MTTIAREFIQEGIEKGIEKGLEQGRMEAKREIACRLLKQHDAVTVSEITGLSLEEVQALPTVEAQWCSLSGIGNVPK